MSSNLVIVAIPNEDDYVWKISSEKVPHMTILFLGDAVGNPNVSQIAGYLEHAVNVSIKRFGMSVDRRGTLGPDQADVLFFDRMWTDDLNDFRSHLLKDNNIKAAYDSVEQFEDPWTPHLTLGYPETPAHEDKRDYPGIHWVSFDKIALWFGDYQGLEYELKSYDYSMEVMMGDPAKTGTAVVNDLLHYGVKGMHWGVRKARNGRPSSDASKAGKAHAKLKTSGIKSLSNEEIQALTKRMDLEKKVKDLHSPVKKGHTAVKSVLALGATLNAAILFSQSPAGKAVAARLKG
jgi:2'-5' RNA ligase